MKQAIILILLTVLALEAGFLLLGFDPVAEIVYGVIALMAAMIAATFLWLWLERTTPLAIGMVVSWFGLACLAAWWWLYNLLGAPVWAQTHPAIFSVLALPIVGSILHFAVIQRSFGFHGMHFLWPIFAAILVSVAVYVTV
ncbi:hypothetical protein [Maritimibacter sp. UBA3975]|uniref:hypothetical protein n=1 Tax=Maritimibacter sp. UBA3975 TaxID=1946833 RepID=UPI000C096403|nr:hypothetical protein [Maritimibacter sp. UBA3975]MAM61214.1 hypothetical protein [Maritimibacter sp.]|tara:strand:- start:14369 stop:14791 length:423 start_codon:yes stop_codon:yes gene_type:complete